MYFLNYQDFFSRSVKKYEKYFVYIAKLGMGDPFI